MKTIRACLCVLLLVASIAGCTDNRQTFFVRDIKIPSDECAIQSDRNAPYRTHGLVDVGLRSNYVLYPLLENAMSSSGGLNPVTAESNRIQTDGAEVRIRTVDGATVGVDFSVDFSVVVEPGGVAGTSFIGIPSGYLDSVAAGDRVIVEFRVLGTTFGGREEDTPWFAFPVDTCYGCLVDFPAAAWDDDMSCYNCNDIGSGGEGQDVCNPGQDEFVDCRQCAYYFPGVCTDPTCP